MAKKYENVIHFKCGCNNLIHRLSGGQKNTIQMINVDSYNNFKCPECNTKINIQNKELLTIDNNKITKELI